MVEYVVYSRGILRTEGSAQDGCDYIMVDDRPAFHTGSIHDDDIVTVFQYYNGTMEFRTDYITWNSPRQQPIRIKKYRKHTMNYWATNYMNFIEVNQTLPMTENV